MGEIATRQVRTLWFLACLLLLPTCHTCLPHAVACDSHCVISSYEAISNDCHMIYDHSELLVEVVGSGSPKPDCHRSAPCKASSSIHVRSVRGSDLLMASCRRMERIHNQPAATVDYQSHKPARRDSDVFLCPMQNLQLQCIRTTSSFWDRTVLCFNAL